ncbi:hypothetical protein [Bacteroides bouchesdurhonensis]|uniref:hypothetical protein n=1 Tax=Bacteroides bouchesdurhonensis TaxID=1841855 RepID=UPI00097F91B3|nr:hypothetical protein [Bacteroides bouchesdurhonensis]
MKSKYFVIILIVFLTITFSQCDKDRFGERFKNKSFVECYINGELVRGEGLRKAFEVPATFHMNYEYTSRDNIFTFNISKFLDSKNNKQYDLKISFAQKTLPIIGEKYYFRKEVDNSKIYGFEDKFYVATIGAEPYLYQCVDTSLIPKEIRKKSITLRTNITTSGYIEFTKIDINKRNISGLFEFEASAASQHIPEATYKVSVTNGRFEGRSIERDRTYYGKEFLFDTDIIY